SGKVVKRSLPIERFMIFLILGSLCIALYLIGSEVPWRKNIIFLLGLLMLFDPAEAAAEAVQNVAGNTTAAEEKSDDNAHSAGKPEMKSDDFSVYNQARKLQLENKPSEAAGIYAELIRNGSLPEVRLASLHNLGVIGHTAGRKKFSESALAAHGGDLDKAIKTLDQAEQELLRAEELYVNVMKNPQSGEITSQTQQKLLLDREEIKKFRKDLEELKKLQQQAQNKTRQAQDKNKSQQNQQQSQDQQKQSQDQQKQGQDQQKQSQDQQKQSQDQQKQGQDQQKQGQDQQQQSAQDALKDAQKAVDDLRKDAEKKSQPRISDMAKSAAEALKDAAEKQEQGDFKGAEKDIEKARQALGAGQQEKKDPDSKNSEQQDKSGKKDKESDNSQPQDDGRNSQNENKMDKQQTDALLDLMSRDEKMLRDAIKNQRNRRIAPVEKDW
ncbi:MAG: hypothetical protein J6S19_06985, partial [Lentisphaeria bacterium]|nr:hypothetical protein [Lentisphaeria bacterium]